MYLLELLLVMLSLQMSAYASAASPPFPLHLQITKSVHQPLQRLRLGERENVICLDPKNNRLLKFHEAQQVNEKSQSSCECMRMPCDWTPKTISFNSMERSR